MAYIMASESQERALRSLSPSHDGEKFSGKEDAMSDASTADPSELDEAMTFCLNQMQEQPAEMKEHFDAACQEILEDPGMHGSLKSSFKIATGVIQNSGPQCAGMKALVEKLCDPTTDVPESWSNSAGAQAALEKLRAQKPMHTEAIDNIFHKLNEFVSLVLDANQPVRKLLSSQTMGVVSLRHLKGAVKRADVKQIEKLSRMAEKNLENSTLTDELQATLSAINAAAKDLVADVKKEEAALEELKNMRSNFTIEAVAHAKAVAENEVNRLKATAGDAAKTAGWWTCVSIGACAGLAILGGICCVAAIAATGGSAAVVIAPAAIALGHVVGWSAIGAAAAIAGGSIYSATKKSKQKKDAAEAHRQGVLQASQATQDALAGKLSHDLESIKQMANKCSQLATDISRASETSQIVKAHLDFLASEGSELAQHLIIADMVLEISDETLLKYEGKLKQLKLDFDALIESAIMAKRNFMAAL